MCHSTMNIKEKKRKEKKMDLGFSFLVTSTKDSSEMINIMGKEYTMVLMGPFMRGNGKMQRKMGEEFKTG